MGRKNLTKEIKNTEKYFKVKIKIYEIKGREIQVKNMPNSH